LKIYLKKYGIRIAVLLAAVVIVVLAVSSLLGGEASFLGNISGAVRVPVQSAATSVGSWFEGIYGYLFKYEQLAAENEYLKAELEQARKKVLDGAEALEENARLEELLEFKETHNDFVFASARIVSWDTSNWTSAFTISKGKNQGLELEDCVVTEYGALVGQVMELGDNWAVVRSVTDVDMNVGALVGESGNPAMVVGDFKLMQRNRTKLTHLTKGAEFQKGDVIVTSGKGGSFPLGLTIGTIDTVETEVAGQTPYGVVEPSYDADDLSQVFIITDFVVSE